MRTTRRERATAVAVAIAVGLWAGAAGAGSITAPDIGPIDPGSGRLSATATLDVEFNTGLQDDFATVVASTDFGTLASTDFGTRGIRFDISLNAPLLPDGEVYEFYFNLDDLFEGDDIALEIETLDEFAVPYTLRDGFNPRFAGGAVFDWAANFAGNFGQSASFIISSPDRPLSLGDLFNESTLFIDERRFDIHFGLRVREFALLKDEKPGVTVGGSVSTPTVPEPATAILLIVGLSGLAFEGRRRQRRD